MAKPTKKEMQSQIITDSVLNFISYMPNPDDIASGTFESYETYRKMKKDPRIKSLLNLLKVGSLNFPLHIVQDESDEKVYDFINGLQLFKNPHKKMRRMLKNIKKRYSGSKLIWKIEGSTYKPENFITSKPER